MLGTPPYIYSAGLLADLLRLGRRRVYRQLEKLLISGARDLRKSPKTRWRMGRLVVLNRRSYPPSLRGRYSIKHS